MVGKSDRLSDLFIDQVLKNTDMGAFATIFVALWTVAPTDAYTSGVPDGTEIDHSTARVAPTFGANADGPSVGRESANTGALNWTTWDGTSPSTLIHTALMSASSLGELHYHGALDASRVINTDENASFAIGDFIINED